MVRLRAGITFSFILLNSLVFAQGEECFYSSQFYFSTLRRIRNLPSLSVGISEVFGQHIGFPREGGFLTYLVFV
jgi:hypothetical protein